MTKTCTIGLVLAVLLIAAPASAQKHELPNFARVNERLYRGGQPSKDGMRRLSGLGVKTIINLRDDDENARTEAKEAEAAGLNYFNIPLKRFGRPNDSQIDRILSLIDAKENGIVFVHCQKGEDRTGMVIALYRISREGWTDQQAIQEAKRVGMRFWQVQMKDYISDYARAHFGDKSHARLPSTNTKN